MTEKNYRDWLERFENADTHGAAEEALDDLGISDQRVRTMLLPILVEALVISRRNASRKRERKVRVRSLRDVSSQERADRLMVEFALSDGRWVSWGEATIEDHQLRIDDQRKLQAGIEIDIQEHQTAIDYIRAAGVTCLAEIKMGQMVDV